MSVYNSWLRRQDVNRTFEDDVECDVDEVRRLLEDEPSIQEIDK